MKLTIACLLVLTMAAGASAQQVRTYGWEDGMATAIGTYGNVGLMEVVTDVVHTGTYALHMVEDPVDGTPQVYVAAIGNLQAGDEVIASFWSYDDTPGASPSSRIWGHWAPNSDIVAGYTGSASGNYDYTTGIGWEEQTFSWICDIDVNPTHEALVVEFRLYSALGAVDFWVDDVTITAPEHAQIVFPNEPPIASVPSTWGAVKSLF
jgi:hypothetical protein